MERDGGDRGAGLIRRFSVITRGEAVGHDMWIDNEFLHDTARRINDLGETGLKSRFTHPGLSGDGLGKLLGRARNAAVIRDSKVVADLHLSESAHRAPDGDLADYVMTLAEKDPDQFGTSIVFSHDEDAEQEYRQKHAKSPDRRNKANLAHARMAKLHAVDAVDEPAANPDGLFHRGQEIGMDADDLLEYALGLSDTPPGLSELEIDPERVRAHLLRFLDSRNLKLVFQNTRQFTGDSVSLERKRQILTNLDLVGESG